MTRIFPPIALVLPFFLQFRLIGLIDTPFGLIVAYVPIVFPLMLWILEGFFRDYPDEILDAARIDGAWHRSGRCCRIVVPTSLPALGVATLFGFLVAWNEFIIALTLTRTPAGQTLPVGIASLITQFQTLWGQMMAAAARLSPAGPRRDPRRPARSCPRPDDRRDKGLEVMYFASEIGQIPSIRGRFGRAIVRNGSIIPVTLANGDVRFPPKCRRTYARPACRESATSRPRKRR